MQGLKCRIKLVGSCEIETASHCQKTNARTKHISLRDRRKRDCVANNAYCVILMIRRIFHRTLYSSAARTKKKLAPLGIGLPLHRLTVDRRYSITKAQAGALGRGLGKRGTNESVYIGAFAEIFNCCANAEVLRALFRSEGCVLDRIEVGRMGIKHA